MNRFSIAYTRKHLAQCGLIFLCLAITGCISPYQQKVIQGNQVPSNTIAQLQEGMSKQEVQALIGNPLIKDAFNNNRWDYFYSSGTVSSKKMEQKAITLIFVNNELRDISGDLSFSELEQLRQTPEKEPTGGTVITKPTQKKKGIFSR